MERRKLSLVVVILLVSMFLFLSCGNSESGKQSKVVGIWYRIDNEDRVELFIDKTFMFGNGNNGNWILLPDDRFKFTSRNGEVFMGFLGVEALIITINNKKAEVFFKHPAPPPEQNISKLIGKWKDDAGNTFDFKPDGTVNITHYQGGTGNRRYVFHGRYIKIILNDKENESTAIIKIGDNDLSLIPIGGMPEILRKIN